MPLFVDGQISSISDLKQYESSILELAAGQGIDLTTKLTLAERELGIAISEVLTRRRTWWGTGHGLGSVLVTEPLLHAHILWTLSLVYRDLANSQLNDRHLAKYKEYAQLAEQARRQLFEAGLGICGAPVRRADQAALSEVSGGLLTNRTYYVRVAYVASNGSTGALSPLATADVQSGFRLRVSQSHLDNSGTQWHVYVGATEDDVTRQTDSALGPTDVWAESTSGLRGDLPVLPLQTPDYFIAQNRELMRG